MCAGEKTHIHNEITDPTHDNQPTMFIYSIICMAKIVWTRILTSPLPFFKPNNNNHGEKFPLMFLVLINDEIHVIETLPAIFQIELKITHATIVFYAGLQNFYAMSFMTFRFYIEKSVNICRCVKVVFEKRQPYAALTSNNQNIVHLCSGCVNLHRTMHANWMFFS